MKSKQEKVERKEKEEFILKFDPKKESDRDSET